VLVVLAVGGNALLPRGAGLDARVQQEQLATMGSALGRLARENQLVVVHGNGPQVGLLAAESGSDPELTSPYPLDDLVAETQGLIGYWLQQTIVNNGGGPAVTLVSRTVVDPEDPAFGEPTKFIGQAYDRSRAESLAAEHGWTVRQDGQVWRRVVPSPVPRDVVELDAVDLLVKNGSSVVIAGGGGIPVVPSADGLRGVEAVVDKDLVAGLVAERLGADLFVVVTDVAAVLAGYGTPQERPIGATTPDQLDRLELPDGSMGPKVRAVASFVRASGHRAAIGALAELGDVVAGDRGTQVRPDPH